MAAFGPMIVYWHHFVTSGKRIGFNTDPKDTIAAAFLKMYRQDGQEPDPLHTKARLRSVV